MKTNLIEIFQTIRAIMQPYAVDGFKNTIDTDSAFHLYTENQMDEEELNKNEIYFFGLEIKADFVGLYYRTIYSQDEMKILFSDDLIATLKESGCFHITKLDDLLLEQVSNALKIGFKVYKQKGWV